MSLDFLKTDEKVEEVKDSVGGNAILATDAYPGVIEYAYLGKSKGGANSLNVSVALENGAKYRETLWITSGTAKGEKPYYESKQGKKVFLPGYQVADAICMLSAGSHITEMETEEKIINVYDYDAQKELPIPVPCLVAVHDMPIILGVENQLTDKTALDAASGKYLPTGETRNVNAITKVFCNREGHEGLTVTEAEAGGKAVFIDTWKEKFQGQVADRTDKKAATANGAQGAPTGSDTAAASPNLFA